MDIETVRDYCLQKKAADEAFPFDDRFLVFRVMGKMFAVIDLERTERLTLKCDPDYALELRDHHPGIEGAWHFNKRHWNQVSLRGDIDDALIRHLIDHSYEEVLKKFTRKMKSEYETLP